eukprot:gene25267-33798_t
MDLVKSINTINRLGGSYMEKAVSDATCMIVNRVGGKDFQICCRMNIPLVAVTWLHDCLRHNKAMKMISYPVKPFTGLSITCTQLVPEERLKLQQLVEENGGTYNVQLVKDSVTHLVAKEASGDKFSYAKLWNNVHVISIEWIEECARSKVWVPESSFSIVPPLEKKSKKVLKSNHKKERAKSPVKSTIPPAQQPVEVAVMDSQTVLQHVDRILRAKMAAPLLPTRLPPDKDSIFARELFFVEGFHSQIMDYIVRLILWGGGHRCMILNQTVTMVLIGDLADKSILPEIDRHPYGVQFVNMTWLIDAMFGFQKVVEIVRTETPFKELSATIDFDKIGSLEDLCDYQKFTIINKVVEGEAPPDSEVASEGALQGRCLSTGTLHSSLEPENDNGDFPIVGGDDCGDNRNNDIMSYDGDTALCALELELEVLKRKPVATSSSNIYSRSSNKDNYNRASNEQQKGMKFFIPPTSSRGNDLPNKRARGESTRTGAKDENAVNYSYNDNHNSSSSSSSSSMKGLSSKRGPPQIDWQEISPSMRLHSDFMGSDLFNNNMPKMGRKEEDKGSRSLQLQHAEESQIVIYADIPGKLL